MDPNKLNFGSGNKLLGGVEPLQQVLQQHMQGDAGATALQSPSSPGFDPITGQMIPGGGIPAGPAPQPQGMPPAPQGMPAPQDPTMMGGAPLPQQTPESQIILDALNTRLKHDSKMNEKKLDMGIV